MFNKKRKSVKQQKPLVKINRQPCEVYSRIVGYIRPVQNWHIGKREEFKDRKTYDKILHLSNA